MGKWVNVLQRHAYWWHQSYIPCWILISLTVSKGSLKYLTHYSPNKMDDTLQMRFSNAVSWIKIIVFWLKFNWNWSPRIQLQYSSTGLDNGLAPVRRQAIIWRNDGIVYWHIYVTLPEWVKRFLWHYLKAALYWLALGNLWKPTPCVPYNTFIITYNLACNLQFYWMVPNLQLYPQQLKGHQSVHHSCCQPGLKGASLQQHGGLNKMADILQTAFSNVFPWMKIIIFWFTSSFHWSLFLRFSLTISQHWFR